METNGAIRLGGGLSVTHIRGPHGDAYRFFAWLLNLPRRAWQRTIERLK